MTAASSGDPGGSRERWPIVGSAPCSEFGAITYLLLRSKNEAITLTTDPFIVGKAVEFAAGGPIEGASLEAQGTRYTLKVRNHAQVKKLLKMTKLLDGTEVVVELHPRLNVSRCVVFCRAAIRMKEEDILTNLASQGVIQVQRITRKEHGNIINTAALILTFNRCNYPLHVKIGLFRVDTRAYYPNPLLCYSCVRYGHPRVRCPGPKRCLNCSAEHELKEGEVCPSAAHCINCSGSHRPNDRQCPVFKKEMEVVRMKVDHNLTFPEARKRIEQGVVTYAAAAAQQTADRKRLDELEKKMEEKDAVITHLLGEIAKKDQMIEQLMARLGMSPECQPQSAQVNDTTKPLKSSKMIQPAIPSQTTNEEQIVEPAGAQKSKHPQCTSSRNQSAVTAQPKINDGRKKKKRHNRSNNSSPGRQSPPPKKTPAEQPPSSDQDVVSIDEDEDIEETPPSQHFR